jgi:site-specific DNA recombinase
MRTNLDVSVRTVRTGKEYLRVSFDRSGRERSHDEQHEDNERACAQHWIRLDQVAYRERGSASRYARKARDDFARLLDDLRAGRFGAEVLVLWESSRGSRKVGEWVTLIELCELHGVMIFVTTHGREYDPSNARDRRSLLEDAVDSEYESAKVSARARRASAANAAAGKPHGVCPFGYVRRYDERTRQLIAQEPHPEQAPLVQELFRRLKSGHSLRGIAQDWAARGVVNGSGRPFVPAHLRVLAMQPAYAGIRAHVPQGRRTPRLQAGVQQVPATWPALVSQAEFLAVQQILTDPKRRTARPGRAKYLLSMIAKCEVCGDVLAITLRKKEHGEYQCRQGHVRCDREELDTVAQEAIFKRLVRPDAFKGLNAGDGQPGTELAAVRDAKAQARTELQTLRDAVGAGRLSVESLVAAEPQILQRIADLNAREDELATPSVLRGLITPGADVRERWATMPMSARRDVARMLLTRDKIGELRVARRPAGRTNVHVPAADRVRWRTENHPVVDHTRRADRRRPVTTADEVRART